MKAKHYNIIHANFILLVIISCIIAVSITTKAYGEINARWDQEPANPESEIWWSQWSSSDFDEHTHYCVVNDKIYNSVEEFRGQDDSFNNTNFMHFVEEFSPEDYQYFTGSIVRQDCSPTNVPESEDERLDDCFYEECFTYNKDGVRYTIAYPSKRVTYVYDGFTGWYGDQEFNEESGCYESVWPKHDVDTESITVPSMINGHSVSDIQITLSKSTTTGPNWEEDAEYTKTNLKNIVIEDGIYETIHINLEGRLSYDEDCASKNCSLTLPKSMSPLNNGYDRDGKFDLTCYHGSNVDLPDNVIDIELWDVTNAKELVFPESVENISIWYNSCVNTEKITINSKVLKHWTQDSASSFNWPNLKELWFTGSFADCDCMVNDWRNAYTRYGTRHTIAAYAFVDIVLNNTSMIEEKNPKIYVSNIESMRAIGRALSELDDYSGAAGFMDEPDPLFVYTGSDKGPVYWAADELAGDTRYETALKVVDTAFSESKTDSIIIATGNNFPDSLCASPLAGLLECPIILVNDQVSDDTFNEINSITNSNLKNIIIVGGESAVPSIVYTTLNQAYPNANTIRVSGEDRYETSEAIFNCAQENFGKQWGDTAVLACGTNYPDALSISPYCYNHNAPIVLAENTSIASNIVSNFNNVIVVGGEAAVSIDNANLISSHCTSQNFTRLSGETRYETSKKISQYSISNGASLSGMCIATGGNFPDALACGPLAGKNNSIILLQDMHNAGDENDYYCLTGNIYQQTQECNGFYFIGGSASPYYDERQYVARYYFGCTYKKGEF